MKKFLVLYLAPVAVLENWAKTEESERKATEEKMRNEWVKWTNDHVSMIVDFPAGAGKTKVVTSEGVSDIKNDIMLYATVQAESHALAAAMFEGHPHLQIPQASIEIMEINALVGMNQ